MTIKELFTAFYDFYYCERHFKREWVVCWHNMEHYGHAMDGAERTGYEACWKFVHD